MRCSQVATNYAGGFDWNLLMNKAYQYGVQIMDGRQDHFLGLT